MIKQSLFKNLRRFVQVMAVVLLLLIAYHVYIYFDYFSNGFSKNSDDWGNYGAYFAGTVGVLIATLNFLAILYITIKIYRDHDIHWLTELRAPFYKDIIEKAYSLDIHTLKDDKKLTLYISWLENTDFDNLLFLQHKEQKEIINESKKSLLEVLKKINNNKKFFSSESTDLMDQFHVVKSNFAVDLGNIMKNIPPEKKKNSM